MPIDERLRAGLDWDPDHAPPPEPHLLDAIVGRAIRRRRIRVAGVAMTAAVAAALVAVGAPWALSRSQVDSSEPVTPPDTTTAWTPIPPISSPLDEHWTGSTGSRVQRLAALDGTGLESYGPTIYADYFTAAVLDLRVADGTVTMSTSKIPSGRFVGDLAAKASLHGTFTVRGHRVAMRFNELAGTTVFRWTRVDQEPNERLTLTFVRTTSRALYGAPAEVFFRMWSARPLWIWGCC
jgi:hypothetical protein